MKPPTDGRMNAKLRSSQPSRLNDTAGPPVAASTSLNRMENAAPWGFPHGPIKSSKRSFDLSWRPTTNHSSPTPPTALDPTGARVRLSSISKNTGRAPSGGSKVTSNHTSILSTMTCYSTSLDSTSRTTASSLSYVVFSPQGIWKSGNRYRITPAPRKVAS